MKSVAFALMAIFGAGNSMSYDGEIDLVDLAQIDLKQAFDDFKATYNRQYASVSDEFEKFATFLQNMQTIAGFNSDGTQTSKMRINQFGDWTRNEYLDYVHQGYINANPTGVHMRNLMAESKPNDGANPTSVDWRQQGVVTPIKNQGQCGSCWAFSTTGSLECRYAIKTGTLNSLSEQQLVDCSGSYGNEGCNGGLMDSAFKYIEHEGGLCTESEYPYTARDGSCKASSCGTLYNPITGYTDVRADNEGDLETASVAGCVSVAIEADQTAFQYYSSGILTGNCGTSLDHGVLVVGYGVSGSQEYWIVKNSWGTSWGEQGYINICKDCDKNGSRGECGINMQPSYPVAK